LRLLSKPWTEEDCRRLGQLRAAGATAARAALALKRSEQSVRVKAREIGTPFDTKRELRSRLKQKEIEARTAAGLSPVQDNPKSRHR
jgi:hypothetical protein